MRVTRNGRATYQCNLPLLHPVILLLLQLFDIVRHRPSDGMRMFEHSCDAHVALDLLGHVPHNGFGDSEDVAEACRHVKVVIGDNNERWWRWMMVVV